MKIPFVDLHAQYLSIKEEIDEAIAEVIAQSAYIRGPQVDAFEQAWAKTIGVKRCVSCANGTDAIYIALRALGAKAGDEIITSAHTWISTSETITQAGCAVVFCDTDDDDTFTIDPADIERKITSATVGIIPVHLYGQPADMDAIMGIARKHNLWVIEDCAQAHLATYKGQTVGTFGNIATFSFYPGKNLGAYGDAGGIVTNDDQLADWMATFARHGGKNNHVLEGINSRMDGIQAAVLNAKLPHLSNWTTGRRRVAARYNELLQDVEDVTTPKLAADRDHVYHLYVIRADGRDSLQTRLAAADVSTAVHYPRALPFCPAYAYLEHTSADFPAAYSNQSRILSLPMYAEMSEEAIEEVVFQIRRALSSGRAHETNRVLENRLITATMEYNK
jgi:dTDP-4-amino-4,6-dideoxygalactose transaminase